MKLFELKPRFSESTGKPIDPRPAFSRYVCDYCGAILDPNDNPSGDPDPVYIIQESGNTSPQFNEMRIKGHNIDLYELFSDNQEFRYCQNWDFRKFCELNLAAEWIREINNPGSIFHQAALLAHAMYAARLRVIEKMLDNNYTYEQLQLIVRA